MIVCLDTSSMVKLYVEEAGSAIVRDVTQKAAVIATSKIAYAEARAAFARKQRDDGFSITALKKIVEDLNRDWESYFIIEVTDGIIRAAGDIAEKYLLRGFDSIHLASAVNLKGKIMGEVFFSSTDSKLNRAAGKEGIKVL